MSNFIFSPGLLENFFFPHFLLEIINNKHFYLKLFQWCKNKWEQIFKLDWTFISLMIIWDCFVTDQYFTFVILYCYFCLKCSVSRHDFYFCSFHSLYLKKKKKNWYMRFPESSGLNQVVLSKKYLILGQTFRNGFCKEFFALPPHEKRKIISLQTRQ